MHAFASLAWEQNWVVSMVSVSKESPLDRLDYLYPKIVTALLRPGSNQPGLEPIVTKALAEPYLLAESRAIDLSERTRAVLDNLSRQNVGMDELLEDLSGRFIPLTLLKKIHRENFSKPLKIASSRTRDEILHYLSLIDWLIGRAGFQGWLILMDEVELIGKFGRGGRARSYANMGRLMQGVGERTVSVWAVAGNFQHDVITVRQDSERAPDWLLSRPKEAQDADLARLALDELSAARPLSRPTSVQVREVVERIYDLHQEAYHWSAPVRPDRFYEVVQGHIGTMDARLRTWVRLAIALLDLWLQYGVEGMEVRASELREIDLAEAGQSGDAADDLPDLIERRPLF
jgi:hypothetical protein